MIIQHPSQTNAFSGTRWIPANTVLISSVSHAAPSNDEQLSAIRPRLKKAGVGAGRNEPVIAALEGAAIQVQFAAGEEMVFKARWGNGPRARFARIKAGAIHREIRAVQNVFSVGSDELRFEVIE